MGRWLFSGLRVVVGLLVCWVAVVAVVSGSDSSCRGRCGPGTDRNKPCQCNTVCLNYNDCCSDYTPYCVPTCRDRCGDPLDNSKPCQCNEDCVRFGDCCDDFGDLCVQESCTDSLADVTEYFWNHDVNRVASSEYTVNWQTRVSSSNRVDRSTGKLFTNVNRAVLNKPTFRAFIVLLDNYNVSRGNRESHTAAERREIEEFYTLISATPIFHKLYAFLRCEGHVSSKSDFQSKFYNLWFDLYGRSSSSTILDSSGFEHVMVGEMSGSGRSAYVSGFHSWIQFYEEERLGRAEYYGYVRRILNNPSVIGANFAWNHESSSRNAVKSMGSFFLGSSPEFDLALYTVCAFESPNSVCTVRLGGTNYRIQTWDNRHKDGLQIGSAYPAI